MILHLRDAAELALLMLVTVVARLAWPVVYLVVAVALLVGVAVQTGAEWMAERSAAVDSGRRIVSFTRLWRTWRAGGWAAVRALRGAREVEA